MSPSELAGGSPPTEPPPREVLAIALALAVAWQAAKAAPAEPEPERSPWPWAGERWERPASHRWS